MIHIFVPGNCGSRVPWTHKYRITQNTLKFMTEINVPHKPHITHKLIREINVDNTREKKSLTRKIFFNISKISLSSLLK